MKFGRIELVCHLPTALLILGIGRLCAESGLQAPAAAKPASSPTGRFDTQLDADLRAVFVDLDGSRGRFLTERYLRPGFNAANFLLDIRPKRGQTSFFDFMKLTSSGLGDSSPYQQIDFRMARRKMFDFRSDYRKYNYFFDLPSVALGLHPENSAGRFYSFDLKLWPDRTASLRLGYRRNQLYGTAYSTAYLNLDTFQLRQPARLSSDDFVVGTTLKLETLTLTLDQTVVRLKDDREYFPNANNPVGLRGNQLVDGERNLPTRIMTPTSRAVARYQAGGRYEATGRYMFSDGDVELSRYDTFLYRLGTGAFAVRQLISGSGVSDKPTHWMDVNQTADMTGKLSLHHYFHFNRYTLTGLMNATGVLRLIEEATRASRDVPVEEQGGTRTDYWLLRNRLELDYQATPSVSLLGHYTYSDRHVGFAAHAEPPGGSVPQPRPQVSIGHSGGGGAGWNPGLKFRLRGDVEAGTTSAAFYRIEPLSFVRWSLRGDYRPKPKLILSGSTIFNDNQNDTPGIAHNLYDRQASVQASWAPSERLLVTGGYNYLQIHSSTDIVFYVFSELTNGKSVYQADTHVANAAVRLPAGKRLSLRLGYQFIKDTGISYPFRQHVPNAGFSFQLAKGVSLEADWWYHGYNENLSSNQDYRANVLSAGVRFRTP